MSEWHLPEWLRSAFFEELLACDVCEGIGHKTERGKTHSGHDFRLVRHQEPCSACHGTGMAGVRWEDRNGFPCMFHSPDHNHDDGCRLVLVVPLERSETHA